MKPPVPQIPELPAELNRLLTTETEVQKHQRWQALSLFRTRPARTRPQVAQLLGVQRHTVRRWLAA